MMRSLTLSLELVAQSTPKQSLTFKNHCDEWLKTSDIMVHSTIKIVDFSREEFISIIREAFQDSIPKTCGGGEQLSKGDDLLTREQTSKLLNVSYTTLFHWNNDNTLPAHKIGRKVFYLRQEVMNKIKNAA